MRNKILKFEICVLVAVFAVIGFLVGKHHTRVQGLDKDEPAPIRIILQHEQRNDKGEKRELTDLDDWIPIKIAKEDEFDLEIKDMEKERVARRSTNKTLEDYWEGKNEGTFKGRLNKFVGSYIVQAAYSPMRSTISIKKEGSLFSREENYFIEISGFFERGDYVARTNSGKDIKFRMGTPYSDWASFGDFISTFGLIWVDIHGRNQSGKLRL